ncbi:uncharacterized protein LOC136079254 [Hydra vulgaris]|uniref:Uncharacterized protein LOC136079254 n=1 Tax=Hydra vulgaris TaxID=6087 RepID=A0ABM4BPL0_HYDVU
MKIDDVEDKDLISENVQIIKCPIPKIIVEHNIGFLMFSEETRKAIIIDSLRIEIVKHGFKHFQNIEGPFLPTKNRFMNKPWFFKKLGNRHGEQMMRSWLVYSPSKKSAFCFCCLLFLKCENQSSLEQEIGFNHWKAPERMNKELERNLFYNRGIIDAELEQQIQRENQKWCDIFKRLLHCIKYLAMQNLALRGHRESLQSNANSGNLLGLLKLVSNFDPVIKDHLKFAESHPGSTTYLLSNIQNEFIHIIASTVRANLLEKIHKAKYSGLIFDSTPDLAHCKQMSEDAASLAQTILEQIEKDNMNVENCRSQCYDNAAVMAGHKSGVHQRIKKKNNLAIFVNCDNHSPNLVGVHAAKEEVIMVTFFGTIDALYVFFSRSTQRWQKLKDAVPISLKSDSDTRQSAKTESVKPVHTYIDEIVEVLQNLIVDENASNETKSDANQLINKILKYDFLTLLGFWNKIFGRIDRVQMRLQDPKMNFRNAASDLKSLQDYFQSEREVLVNDSIKEGVQICNESGVDFERRQRKKKRMDGEMSRDVGLTAKEEINQKRSM